MINPWGGTNMYLVLEMSEMSEDPGSQFFMLKLLKIKTPSIFSILPTLHLL